MTRVENQVIAISSSYQDIDGIFQISLDEEGKCTYFKQWRFTR